LGKDLGCRTLSFQYSLTYCSCYLFALNYPIPSKPSLSKTAFLSLLIISAYPIDNLGRAWYTAAVGRICPTTTKYYCFENSKWRLVNIGTSFFLAAGGIGKAAG